jgi:hypothetical protein
MGSLWGLLVSDFSYDGTFRQPLAPTTQISLQRSCSRSASSTAIS